MYNKPSTGNDAQLADTTPPGEWKYTTVVIDVMYTVSHMKMPLLF